MPTPADDATAAPMPLPGGGDSARTHATHAGADDDAAGAVLGFAEAEGAVTLAAWWHEAALAHGHHRAIAALAAGSSVAAHRHADELQQALAALRQAATYLGLALLDGAAASASLRARVDALLAAEAATSAAEASTAARPPGADDITALPAEAQPTAPAPSETGAAPEVKAKPTAPPPKAAPPVRLTDAHLDLLAKALQGGAAATKGHQDAAGRDLAPGLIALSTLRDQAGGVATSLGDLNAINGELAQVERGVANGKLWAALEGELRQLAIEWLAARLRALQSHLTMASQRPLTARVDAAIVALSGKIGPAGGAKKKAVGFCHGLARAHGPRHDTWLADALHIQERIDQATGRFGRRSGDVDRSRRVDDGFRRLREASERGVGGVRRIAEDLVQLGVAASDPRWRAPLEPHLAHIADSKALRRVHLELVRALNAEAQDASGDDEIDAPAWPLLARTRGRRLLLVGGDGRQDRIPVIQRAFELGEVEWADIPKNAPRARISMVQRMESGKYDFVVCLQRFVSHELTDAVFGVDKEDVACMLATGYGVGQLRQAFERFLGHGAH